MNTAPQPAPDDNPLPAANVEAVNAALHRFLAAAYSASPRVREIVDQVIAEHPEHQEAASQDTKRGHQ